MNKIIIASVIATAALVACGKKEEVKVEAPAAAPAAATAPVAAAVDAAKDAAKDAGAAAEIGRASCRERV